ncbi:MAG: hypothetical protein ACK443_11010 [Methylococcaceae bacterium]
MLFFQRPNSGMGFGPGLCFGIPGSNEAVLFLRQGIPGGQGVISLLLQCPNSGMVLGLGLRLGIAGSN